MHHDDRQETAVEIVEEAFRLLKREVYAQKHNLALRQRVAEFEVSSGFGTSLHDVADVATAPNPESHKLFNLWLSRVGFTLLPKSVDLPRHTSESPMNGIYFSNEVTAMAYEVRKLNYFFDAPIELHLLGVLWLKLEGRHLDEALADECIGVRLHPNIVRGRQSTRLFKTYPVQYAAWRDGAVKRAKQLLMEEKKSVCILSLDFQSFFYSLSPDFAEVERFIYARREEAGGFHDDTCMSPLTKTIEAICRRYHDVVREPLASTHGSASKATGLPIEICFSPVLANWCMREFDAKVIGTLKPHYYGRYVDDLLFVLPPDGVRGDDPIHGVLHGQFCRSGPDRLRR